MVVYSLAWGWELKTEYTVNAETSFRVGNKDCIDLQLKRLDFCLGTEGS